MGEGEGGGEARAWPACRAMPFPPIPTFPPPRGKEKKAWTKLMSQDSASYTPVLRTADYPASLGAGGGRSHAVADSDGTE